MKKTKLQTNIKYQNLKNLDSLRFWKLQFVHFNTQSGFTHTPKMTSRQSHRKGMPFLVSGFTLIESLIAISILLIAITASMALTTNSLATARLAKNRLVATGLAQETLELIRNRRDVNFIEMIDGNLNRDWLEGINKDMGGPAQPCRPTRADTAGCIVRLHPNDFSAAQNFVDINHTPNINKNRASVIYRGGDENDPKRIYRHKTTEGLGVEGMFARFVTVEEFADSNGEGFSARVTVWVEWEESGDPQEVVATAYLFDWLPL